MAYSTESKLINLATGQWGMFTAAQAGASGVARSTLLRREQSGALERVRTGVYRIAVAPADPADDLRAAWLATNPGVVARDRRDRLDAIVGGAAAASTHGIGDLHPSPYLIYTTIRRRTRHDDVRYSARALSQKDVMILDGLPVTTPERTIADLLDEAGADVSTVADALRDAEMAAAHLDVESLVEHLQPHSKRLGYASGTALYEHLRSLTCIDEARLRDLIEFTDLALQMNAAMDIRLREVLAPLALQMNRQMRDSTEPLVHSSALMHRPPVSLTIDLSLPQIRGPKITLPPNLLPKITLLPSTQAMLDQLARMSMTMPSSYPSGTPRPLSAPPKPPEELEVQ